MSPWSLGTLLFLLIVTMVRCEKETPFESAEVKRLSPPSCGESADQPSVRKVVRNFLSSSEVDWLVDLIERGMAGVEDKRGPTIMDPDLGLVLAPGGNVSRVLATFTPDELDRYGQLLRRVHDTISGIHSISKTSLYHTAPTFIARISPMPDLEKTKHVHDEYWHLHCDKNNTEHYDYSALVYLSDYAKDFEGGIFEFHEHGTEQKDHITRVFPERGSLITFSSGIENPHRVTPVTKGVRMAWSLWFTCDRSKRFLKSRLKIEQDSDSDDDEGESYEL